jgi:hypothetical protein
MHNLYGDMCNSPNPDDVIGKSDVFMEGNKLIGRVTFEPESMNPLAEKVFRKIVFGTLRTASVGFTPLKGWRKGEKDKGEDKAAEYSDEHDLLEWSVVNIPSNPSAGKREFSVQTDRALKYIINLMENKITADELRKMTVAGVIGLVTGESLAKDKEERDISDQTQIDKDLKQLEETPEYIRQMAEMELELEYNNNDKEVERINKRFEKQYNAQLEGFSRDFTLITPEMEASMIEEDFGLNMEDE